MKLQLKKQNNHKSITVKLQCLKCNKKFYRSLGPISYNELACSHCDSTNINLEE